MGCKYDLNGHRNVGDWARYNEREQELATGHGLFSVYEADGRRTRLIGKFTAEQLEQYYAALPRQNRRQSRQGAEVVWSAPSSVRAAMEDKGLLTSPNRAFKAIGPPVHGAMREFAKHAVGKTTGNRHVPVTLRYAVGCGVYNRAGEIDPTMNVFVFDRGRDAAGKERAVDLQKLGYAQAAAQAMANMDLSNRLLKEGILCAPHRKSIAAVGYSARTQRAGQIAAAAGAQAGPRRRARAARSTRARKPKGTTWREAVGKLAYTVMGVVAGLVTEVDRSVQRRLAARAVKAAYRYHAASGSARFTGDDVKSTAAHLCLPHVRPEIFERAFERLSRDPDRLGVRVVREYQTGHVMYAPAAQVAEEQRLARAIHEARHTKKSGLSRRQVARALAGFNLDTHQYQAAQDLANPRRATFADDARALKHAAAAYHRSGRDVHAIGVRGLGVEPRSIGGFLDGTRRTGHMRALWLGLRQEGFFGDPLRVAELIRAARPSIGLRRGSLIVLSPGDLENAAAVRQLLRLAEKKNCKVLFAGPSARQYQDLANAHINQNQQTRGIRP